MAVLHKTALYYHSVELKQLIIFLAHFDCQTRQVEDLVATFNWHVYKKYRALGFRDYYSFHMRLFFRAKIAYALFGFSNVTNVSYNIKNQFSE